MEKLTKINVCRGRKLSLDGATVIGQGACGKVYLLPDDNVVKVLYSADYEEAEREIQLSKWAFSKGIPTAISYDLVEVDGHPGLVYESLGRGNLRNEFRDKPECYGETLAKYIDLLHTFNGVTADEGQLPSYKRKYLHRMETAKGVLTEEEYAKMLRMVEAIPEDNHLVHGDFHVKNVKVKNGQLFLIDLDTMSTGNVIFELAGLFCPYKAYREFDKGTYSDFFEIDGGILERVYYEIIDDYFRCVSEKDKEENKRKIALLTYVHMIYCVKAFADDGDDIEGRTAVMYSHVKELLPTVDDFKLVF